MRASSVGVRTGDAFTDSFVSDGSRVSSNGTYSFCLLGSDGFDALVADGLYGSDALVGLAISVPMLSSAFSNMCTST